MFKKGIKDFLISSVEGGSLTLGEMLMNMVVALIIVVFIYYIYKKTYDGVLYSKNFNVTLILVGVITSVIVMVISGNIALSLGMIGALSIVRFRTAVKEPKDIAYLFWSIATGIVCGVGAYRLAAISAVFIAGILVIASKRISISQPYILILKSTKNKGPEITKVILDYCRNHKVRTTTSTANHFETVYEVRLKHKDSNEFVSKLNHIKDISSATLISYTGDIEAV
ncbi:DUF4956 domain-containing protein [Nanoarchaeota archaeon]